MLRSAAINTCIPSTPIWRPPGRVSSKNWSIRAVKRFFTDSTPKNAAFNHQPVISSTARLWGIIGHDYYYQPIASDVDNQPLTYQLLAAPEGMTLTGYEGGEQLIHYRPTAPGDYYVSLFVSDGIGGAAQNFQVYVGAYTGNEAPEILSEPAASATAGREYRHQIAAADYEADPFVFLLEEGPAGMSIDSSTGLILWTPAADDVGSHAVTIAAVDSLGARSEQSFTLTVRGVNLGPSITSTPIVTARQGELYTYPVTAFDPEGDAITFSLLPLPPGNTVRDFLTGVTRFWGVRWFPLAGTRDQPRQRMRRRARFAAKGIPGESQARFFAARLAALRRAASRSARRRSRITNASSSVP